MTEELRKIAEYFQNEMIEVIEENWDECEFAETGMDPDEAEVFLGYSTEDMSQEEIDDAVSEIQLAYYTEGEADLEEIVEKFLICIE